MIGARWSWVIDFLSSLTILVRKKSGAFSAWERRRMLHSLILFPFLCPSASLLHSPLISSSCNPLLSLPLDDVLFLTPSILSLSSICLETFLDSELWEKTWAKLLPLVVSFFVALLITTTRLDFLPSSSHTLCVYHFTCDFLHHSSLDPASFFVFPSSNFLFYLGDKSSSSLCVFSLFLKPY